jgi:hypothetical protein
MANPLINGSNQTRTAQNIRNPMQLMGQFMQNPLGALRQSGYMIPDGMTDPRQIVNYLINNGQLNNSKLSQLQRMAGMFTRK